MKNMNTSLMMRFLTGGNFGGSNIHSDQHPNTNFCTCNANICAIVEFSPARI